jgi:hypothetical protein
VPLVATAYLEDALQDQDRDPGTPDLAFIVGQLIAAFVRGESTDPRERRLPQRADLELGSLGDRGQWDYGWNWSSQSSMKGRSY